MTLSGPVLIIEDELDSCLLWKTYLSRLKFNVYTALTLKEGLELVDKIKPSIIFLDNNLPDGLGWEYVDYIKEQLPDCRINLVSAYEFDKDQWGGKNVKVIGKPLTLSGIKSILLST